MIALTVRRAGSIRLLGGTPPDRALPKRNVVRLEPVLRDVFKRCLSKAKPIVFDAEPSDSAPKTAERAGTVNCIQQLIAPGCACLTVREALHDRPFVDFELVWQRQKVAGFQSRAHLG